MHIRFISMFCVLYLFAASSVAAPRADVRPMDEPALQQALEQLRERHGLAAVDVTLFDDEQQRRKIAGEDGSPVLIGEASALFAGLALAALDADGTLSLETEVTQLAPELDIRNRWREERPVRIADLLSHRAGFDRVRYRDLFAPQGAPALLAGINSAWRSLEPATRPGEQHFSLASVAVAAYLIEKAAGMPYAEVLDRLLFRPLALELESASDSAFPPTAFDEAIGLSLSAPQLASIGRLLLNRGEHETRPVVAAEAVARLEESTRVPGMALGVHVEELAGRKLFTATGGTWQSLVRLAWSPAIRQGYALTLRGPRSEAALRELDALLQGQLAVTRPAPPSVPVSVSLPAGWYRNAAPLPPPGRLYRQWLEFGRLQRCDDGWCFRSVSQPEVRLQGVGGNLLRARDRWFAGWDWHPEQGLSHAGMRWVRVSGAEVLGRLLVAALAAFGVIAAVAAVPWWSWRARGRNIQENLPRLLPAFTLLAMLALQLLLFNADVPALASATPLSIGVFVLSLAVPAGALLSVIASGAAFAWRLPWRDACTCALLALAALANAAMTIDAGLFGFRSWAY